MVHVISVRSDNGLKKRTKTCCLCSLYNVLQRQSCVKDQSHSSNRIFLHHSLVCNFKTVGPCSRRSQWPRSLRRRSAAARLLRFWVRIPPGTWMSVCCECCVLSGRGLCDELITRPEESYRLWCVVVCDLETS